MPNWTKCGGYLSMITMISKIGQRLVLLLLIMSVMLVVSCSEEPTAQSPKFKPRMGRIGVRFAANNSNEFFDKGNGKKIIPMGYNYTHLQEYKWNNLLQTGHSTFIEGMYDLQASEKILFKLQSARYNTVRIFLNPMAISYSKGILEKKYIANVADFIKRANNHGIGVIITIDMIPVTSYGTELRSKADIWWWNNQYIFDSEIALEIKFWQSLIQELKENATPLEAVFAYELRNEFFFHPDYFPFDNNANIIKHPNGVTYAMSNENNKDALMEASFLYWTAAVKKAILVEDPEALVTVGFYGPEPLGRIAHTAMAKSNLDFIDLHLYPELYSLDEYDRYFELGQNLDKLIIIGELGFVKAQEKSINDIKDNLLEWRDKLVKNYDINGWLLWTWYTGVGIELSVPDKNDIIFNAFRPSR